MNTFLKRNKVELKKHYKELHSFMKQHINLIKKSVFLDQAENIKNYKKFSEEKKRKLIACGYYCDIELYNQLKNTLLKIEIAYHHIYDDKTNEAYELDLLHAQENFKKLPWFEFLSPNKHIHPRFHVGERLAELIEWLKQADLKNETINEKEDRNKRVTILRSELKNVLTETIMAKLRALILDIPNAYLEKELKTLPSPEDICMYPDGNLKSSFPAWPSCIGEVRRNPEVLEK